MNLAIAQRAARAARHKAQQLGIAMSVAVVDESGHVVYFERADNSSFITFEAARGKAVTAAGFRRPTREFAAHFRSDPAMWSSLAEKLGISAALGGCPLTRDGAMIGAVGCSGGIGDEDDLCAEAAARAVST